MKISTNSIGINSKGVYSIIEIIVENNGCSITTDVTNSNGWVDEDFIQNLRDIADELEEQNDNILED